MGATADIDIDFADRDAALKGLSFIPALVLQGTKRTAHKTSVYFQNIPTDPLVSLPVIDYQNAGDLGYFKVDFLNLSAYRGVRDEEHLDTLIAKEPLWDLLEEPAIVETLDQIKRHFDVVNFIKPTSIEDLAVVLALIRPGKRHLIGADRHVIDKEIWVATEENYFRKAHAISYALVIVVQMNLLVEQFE